jgi:hypothetical protein
LELHNKGKRAMNENLELLKTKIRQTNQEIIDLVSAATEEDDLNALRKKFDILEIKLRALQREFSTLKILRDISLFEKEENLLEEATE